MHTLNRASEMFLGKIGGITKVTLKYQRTIIEVLTNSPTNKLLTDIESWTHFLTWYNMSEILTD